METAPLTDAHAHAWKACQEENSTAAISEHELAASRFADAATGTQDPEALRILRLLEDQHHQLAHILRRQALRAQTPKTKTPSDEDAASDKPASKTTDTQQPTDHVLSPPPPRSTPKSQSRRRLTREMSSSIASSLATARGIPDLHGQRARPASPGSAGQAHRHERPRRIDKQLSPTTPSEAFQNAAARAIEEAARARESVGLTERTDSHSSADEGVSVPTDEGFQRFYSKFETLFSAISAPLAFASLPLSSASPASASPAAEASKDGPSPTSASTSATTSPSETDLSKIISKPALRALKDDHGLKGPFANATESFFFVPTTGGTKSYAGILSHSGHHHHHSGGGPHLPGLTEEEPDGEGDEFVDASETPVPPSPTNTRTLRPGRKTAQQSSSGSSTSSGRNQVGSRKTPEELELENNTLRQLLDKQSRRLQMWEASSQSQSLALAQSFRARGPPSVSSVKSENSPSDVPPVPPLPGTATTRTGTDHAYSPSSRDSRVRELEAALKQQTAQTETLAKEFERMAHENEKKAEMLQRYRDRWEQLKADARKKRPKPAGESTSTSTTTTAGVATTTATSKNTTNNEPKLEAIATTPSTGTGSPSQDGRPG